MSSSLIPPLRDPPELLKVPRWLLGFPIVGWYVGYRRQVENERRLVDQAVQRGRIPESLWAEHNCNLEIRRKVEEIVIEHAYPAGSTFHPLDPIELMAVIRYGDLNEIAIIRAIEEKFHLKIADQDVQKWIESKTTFVDFIRWIDEHQGSAELQQKTGEVDHS